MANEDGGESVSSSNLTRNPYLIHLGFISPHLRKKATNKLGGDAWASRWRNWVVSSSEWPPYRRVCASQVQRKVEEEGEKKRKEEERSEEEEDEQARRQKIAAELAAMGGMRIGVVPGGHSTEAACFDPQRQHGHGATRAKVFAPPVRSGPPVRALPLSPSHLPSREVRYRQPF
jgi:hypothetical protein